nr:hypothetical protein CFP56_44324 [Quercus suber]
MFAEPIKGRRTFMSNTVSDVDEEDVHGFGRLRRLAPFVLSITSFVKLRSSLCVRSRPLQPTAITGGIVKCPKLRVVNFGLYTVSAICWYATPL